MKRGSTAREAPDTESALGCNPQDIAFVGPDAVWTAVTTPVQVEADETTSVEVPLGVAGFFGLRLP